MLPKYPLKCGMSTDKLTYTGPPQYYEAIVWTRFLVPRRRGAACKTTAFTGTRKRTYFTKRSTPPSLLPSPSWPTAASPRRRRGGYTSGGYIDGNLHLLRSRARNYFTAPRRCDRRVVG